MGKSSMKKEKSDRINALRKKYDDFLEEDKKRKERNEYILGRLDKMRAASMALRVPYEMPRSRLVMGPPMIQYYNPQPREEPFVQTVPFANPYPILRDIPTKLTDNTNDSNIINEISKRFILIPKSSTLHVEKALTQTPQNDDPDWTSKYEILDQLKKCEKENIEFSNTGKSRNGKKISFEEDFVDKTTLQPKVTKDFTNEKREQVTNPNKIDYDIRKVADNKEYDIETFQRNLEEKARIQDEYTDNYNKDNINIDAYKPDIANNAIPIENYDSSAEQECKTNISKSKSQANYTEKDVEEYAPKEKTLEQNNNENIKYNQMEYTTNDNTNVNTSEHNEEQVMINTENKLEVEKIPEQYDDSQVLQIPINSGEAGIEYYPEQNSESKYIQESENVNLENYQQNNAIDSKELQNKFDENNAEYTNYPPEQQLGANYEQYAQNRPAEYYDNTQEPLNQGQAQYEPQQYDNQNDQIQYQEHQQYDQNQPDQYQPYVHEQVQENQPQYDPNQVQGGQYDQLQQPQEYDQENQLNQYEGMYEEVQENQPQYDPNQAQGGQYDQLQQPQEYDLQTQPNQYEGMYEQVQENQPQYDMNKVQEGQYDQLQQPQEYQENQPNQSQGQYQVQPQYEEGLFDQVQEYQSQYDPNQTDNVQYEYSQQDNDQNQVQYDSSQYENQYLEQSEHNIVGEAYDPNASGQTVDENIAGEVVTSVE